MEQWIIKSFDGAKWDVVGLAWPDPDDKVDREKCLAAAGFHETTMWSDDRQYSWVNVWESEGKGWLVEAYDVNGAWLTVLATTVPALLTILGQLVPLVEAQERISLRQDRHMAVAKDFHLRHGHSFDEVCQWCDPRGTRQQDERRAAKRKA